MTDKKAKFDPEKDKEVEDGPLNLEHINQYGKKEDIKNQRRLKGKKDDSDA